MSKHLTLVKDSHSLILKQKNQFEKIDKERILDFEREAQYALQALQKNEYLAGKAANNPESLKNAIINVANSGLSLSPVEKVGYLVPRKDEVVFEPSYFGLMKIATDSGVVNFFHAEIIRENDYFKSNGLGKEPTHDIDYFGERGQIKGVFAAAKLSSGFWIYKVLSKAQVHHIRDTKSEGWKSGKNSAWKTDEEEMFKKTVIRFLCDYIPKSSKSKRLHEAVALTEEVSIDDYTENSETEKPNEETAKKLKDIRDCLEKIQRLETDFLNYAKGVFRLDSLKSLEDLSDEQLNKSLEFLMTQVKKVEAENAKPKEISETEKPKEEEKKEAKKVKNHADKVVAGDFKAGDFFADNNGKRIRDINATDLSNFVQRYSFQIDLNPENVADNIKEFVIKAKEFLELK